ncbi:MAG: regulatory protein RecX [Synergistaceae bacterium]|nr:regulatory protein RecX [Synergistaceae bacterium]
MNKTDEIKEKFFSFLLKKTCTTKQAEEFLSRSKLPENFIKSLMLEAQNMGLIDDGAFAKLFIEGHLHWGNAKIIYELKSKGISHETIYNALDELEEAESEYSRAEKLFDAFRKQGLDDRKIANRLLSRGFSQSTVRDLI